MSARSLLLYFTLLVFFALGLQASAETDVLDGTFFYVSLRFTMSLSWLIMIMENFGRSRHCGSEFQAKLLSFYVW